MTSKNVSRLKRLIAVGTSSQAMITMPRRMNGRA